MAEIKTRIALKYDSLTNWQSSVFNGADSAKWLKAGEVAIVTLGSDVESTHPTNASNQHPLLFKVGTGAHKFDDLAWASALAADVYDWAKCRYVELDGQILKFHNGDKTNPVHTVDLSVFVTGDELTTVLAGYYTKDEIDSLIGDLDVGAIEGRVDDLETAVNTTLPGQISDVDNKFADYTKTADLDTTIDGLGYAKVAEIPTNNNQLTNGAGYQTANDVATAIAGKADSTKVAEDIAAAIAPLATTEALNTLANTHATDKATLEGAIAEKADQSTVSAMYTNAQIDNLLAGKQNTIPAETYDDFGAAADALEEAKGYADQKLLDFENAYIKADDNSTIDKLNEIAAWIADDEAGAVKIIADVSKNAADIQTVSGDLDKVELKLNGIAEGDGTVKNYVDSEVEALSGAISSGALVAKKAEQDADGNVISTTYAKAADLGGIATLNNIPHEALTVDLANDVAKGVEAHGWGNHAQAGYAIAENLHAVATSGNYNDLTNKPTLGALAAKDTIATADIDDKAVTEEKLADAVTEKLNKEWQPVGDYATKTEVANQNAVVLAEAQEYADNCYTAAAGGGLKLNEDKSFAIDDSVTFVFNCGSATTVID